MTKLLLLEHEAKSLARYIGLKIPRGKLCSSLGECLAAGDEIKYPVVVKAQVPIKERLKYGGIATARGRDDLKSIVSRILHANIAGHYVDRVLIERKVDFSAEMYFAMTYDLFSQKPIAMFSLAGGAGIEERAETVIKVDVDLKGRAKIQGLEGIVDKISELGVKSEDVRETVDNLAKLFYESYAELVELNPLVLTEDGLVALDVRISLDDDALATKPALIEFLSKFVDGKRLALHAKRHNFVELDGNVGVVGNGAGLVLATMDMVRYFGGNPANFLDLGGGATADSVKDGLRRMAGVKGVASIVVNVLGGITRCDEVARGIVEAKRSLMLPPMYVRIVGTNEEEASRILEEASIGSFKTMEDVVKAGVEGAGSASR